MTSGAGFDDFICDLLSPLGRVTTRRMFGKRGVFCDGLMFGMIADDTLYFRVDDLNREPFKEAEHSAALTYVKQGKTIPLSFWQAPERLMDEPEELLAWARIALEAAGRVAAKRR